MIPLGAHGDRWRETKPVMETRVLVTTKEPTGMIRAKQIPEVTADVGDMRKRQSRFREASLNSFHSGAHSIASGEMPQVRIPLPRKSAPHDGENNGSGPRFVYGEDYRVANARRDCLDGLERCLSDIPISGPQLPLPEALQLHAETTAFMVMSFSRPHKHANDSKGRDENRVIDDTHWSLPGNHGTLVVDPGESRSIFLHEEYRESPIMVEWKAKSKLAKFDDAYQKLDKALQEAAYRRFDSESIDEDAEYSFKEGLNPKEFDSPSKSVKFVCVHDTSNEQNSTMKQLLKDLKN